ncbi:MAG: permease, partial [Alphaproteobacteria bacterium]|nr:permease [Alphaproteobacteria bacterium]
MSDISLSLAGAARRVYSIDRVFLVVAAALLLGAFFVPEQTLSSVGFAGNGLLQIAPFLAVSIGMAAYAKASGADNLIARVFQGHPVQMVFAAAAFGALSPFCSCGVIPLIAALLAMGVPLAPVMAFWLASPLMDPQMFFLTMGALGLPFAVGYSLSLAGSSRAERYGRRS